MTKTGYRFAGWNTKSDGTGTSYGDEAKIKNLTTKNHSKVTLYAQWTADYSNCPHSGRIDNKWVEINNVVTREATSTDWGEVQKRCSFCGAAVETISVHPYDTYEVTFPDGTVQKVCGWFDSDYSREVYEQVNAYRLENGLNTLVYNSSLEYASNIRALESYVYFSHTRPNGTKWITVTSDWQSGAGENIAQGQETPSKVMQAWKNSPGHNANMLYGINSGETPWQGLSVGCFHEVNFINNIPVETVAWSQHFTASKAAQENQNEVRVIDQPKNINANSGQKITLSLSAKGSNLSYKWEFKAKDSNAWVAVGTGNPCTLIAGADISTGLYRCNIKSSADYREFHIYSEMAQINVLSGTEITKQPQDVNAKADSAASFSITAKGEQLSYQWQYRMSDSSDWKNISGGTSNSVQVTIPASWNGAHVRCVVTDKKGVKLNSRAATIKVTDAVNTEPQGTPSASSGNNSGRYRDLEWEVVGGKSYWYENNMRQGTISDGKCFSYDGTLRGREIYDSASDGWYWLDVNADGAKAVGKEVFMPYIYQNESSWSEDEINNNAAASGAYAEGNYEHAEMADQVKRAIQEGKGKWVRYDNNGRMMKGWVTIEGGLENLYPDQVGNTYYYDRKTGLMARGITVIDGQEYYFDEITGALR